MFLFKNISFSQSNLIQNSSFELYTSLNCVGGASSVNNWSGILSPDYYSIDCLNNYKGVPVNAIGTSYAKHGVSYMGLIAYIKTMETKEYIYQQLDQSLNADTVYCLSFFTSRADNIPYSIKNIGAYFSITDPGLFPGIYIGATPQVVNQSGFITDTIGWSEIQGCFTAQGGEQYIAIGNFNSNVNTDTLFVGTTNQVFGGDGYAYYFIDSVSLWQNSFPVGIKEQDKNELVSIYPNPAKDVITFKFADATEKRRIEIYDAIGGLVISEETNSNNLTLTTNNLTNGVYFYTIKQNNFILRQAKFVIMK